MNDYNAGNSGRSDDESSKEWDSVVKRISERMRSTTEISPRVASQAHMEAATESRSGGAAGGAASAPSAQDIAGELTQLERRALEAEATLATEREAYAVRVQGMESKLRKIEPWIRKLKGEYETAAKERDGLQAKLKRARGKNQDAELRALQSELQAAGIAKDAARAELSALRKQVDNDRGSLQDALKQRITTAEKARDQAVEELRSARKELGESRASAEEVRRLQKELTHLENATAAHKAVARAAQDEQKALVATVAELEKAATAKQAEVRATSRSVDEQDLQLRGFQERIATLEVQLQTARDEQENTELRVSELDSSGRAARLDQQHSERQLASRDQELRSARAEVARMQSLVAKLTERGDELEKSLASAQAEDEETVELTAQLKDARGALEEACAQTSRTDARVAELETELLTAMESGETAQAAHAEAEAKVQAGEDEQEAARASVQDAERDAAEARARAERAEMDKASLETDLEGVRGTLTAVEAENASLHETLEATRGQAASSIEAAEATWKSELAAAEGRSEATVIRAEERAKQAEDLASALEVRLVSATRAREAEQRRLRQQMPSFVEAAVRKLTRGFERVLLDSEDSMLLELSDPGPSSEAAIPDELLLGARSGDDPDWDKVLHDVSALHTEVRGLTAHDFNIQDADGGTLTLSPDDTAAPDDESTDIPAGELAAEITKLVDDSELQEAVEAARDADDSEHDSPDTRTIDSEDVPNVVAAGTPAADEESGEADAAPSKPSRRRRRRKK